MYFGRFGVIGGEVEDALEAYPGTLILVSHDRYFLDKLADRVLHFIPPGVNGYDGNFSDFWEKAKHHFKVDVKGARHGVMRKVRSTGAQTLLSEQDRQVRAPDSTTNNKRKRFKFDSARFKELEAEIKRLEDAKPVVEAELEKLTSKGKTSRAKHRRKRLAEIDSIQL